MQTYRFSINFCISCPPPSTCSFPRFVLEFWQSEGVRLIRNVKTAIKTVKGYGHCAWKLYENCSVITKGPYLKMPRKIPLVMFYFRSESRLSTLGEVRRVCKIRQVDIWERR